MSSSHRIGVLLALGTALISGVSNVVNKTATGYLKDPVFFTTVKNLAVAVALLGVLVLLRKWREVRGLDRRDWIRLVAIGLIGGSIPFALFFTGLSMTSALTASFIHKTLFLWVALLAVPLLREHVGRYQLAAFLLLVGGNFFLGMGSLHLGRGELMIFGATILWAGENIIAKKALATISPIVVASSRMLFGGVLLAAIIVIQGKASLLTTLGGVHWMWVGITAILLLGYVLTWYSAVKRLPVTLVACLLVPATLITNILNQLIFEKQMTVGDISSGVLVLTACIVLILGLRRAVSPAVVHGQSHTI